MKIMIFDDMSRVTEAEVARMLPLVSPERREQALRYKHLLGQFCCLKSWLMTMDGCTKDGWSRYEGRELQWTYNEHGKPFLCTKDGWSMYKGEELPYFSISHCKEGIAVAVDKLPVGIDIEGLRRADKELITRTMNQAEQQAIAMAQDTNRCFTRLWTQKEAVLKCIGTGIEGFEQLQQTLTSFEGMVQTFETDHYIYSIATTK